MLISELIEFIYEFTKLIKFFLSRKTILSENIQIMSRAKITGLINNTNLSYLSEAKHLLESLDFADEAAKALGVPLAYTAGTKEILASLPQNLKNKAFCLDLFMKLPFDALQ